MKLQKLYSYVRKALDTYTMIEEGDKIAIGISGGKDSLALLYALAGIRRFYPQHFDLVAITVHLGYPNFNLEKIKELCNDLDVESYLEETEIGMITEELSKQESPCSICAKMRKGALNNKALELGCNKIAYAHHKDDIVETAMMSLLYEGRFHSFDPVTYLEKTKLSVIRPMMYVSESEVVGFIHKYNVPTVENPCPYDGHTKREYVKQLINSIDKENRGTKNRLFTAVENGLFIPN